MSCPSNKLKVLHTYMAVVGRISRERKRVSMRVSGEMERKKVKGSQSLPRNWLKRKFS